MKGRALLIALVLAGIGVALLVFYMRRYEAEASGGDPVRLLTAVKPIDPGVVITEEMLATRVVPRAYVEDRAILESERGKIVGLRMGRRIEAQQTLMWTDLSIAMEERRNLSALVQPGMRAVTIRASSLDDKTFSLIRPGDRIDVIATLTASESRDQRSSVVLLQNVLVLASGSDTGGGEPLQEKHAIESNDMVLSLSLNIPEAQLMSLASEKGRLTVALRNPDDVRVTEGIADINSSALQDNTIRKQLNAGRGKPGGPVEIKGQGVNP